MCVMPQVDVGKTERGEGCGRGTRMEDDFRGGVQDRGTWE